MTIGAQYAELELKKAKINTKINAKSDTWAHGLTAAQFIALISWTPGAPLPKLD